MRTIVDFPSLLFASSFAVLGVSAYVGAFRQKKLRPFDADDRQDFGIVQGTALSLLGLLIGFTFSMAMSRYEQRRIYEEAEANAIGTEYARAGLLPAADTKIVRDQLISYLDRRVLFYTTRDAETTSANRHRYGPTAERTVVRRPGSCCSPTDNLDIPGRRGHERCVELRRVHAGRLVEPYSN